MSTWSDLLDDAERELREWVERNRPIDESEVGDAIFEIADGQVPVYDSALLELALDNPELATTRPEIFAYSGEETAVNAIAGRAFEEIEQHLWEVWRDHEDEWTSDPDEAE